MTTHEKPAGVRPETLIWAAFAGVLLVVLGFGLWKWRSGAAAAAATAASVQAALPVLGTLPNFTFTERSGRTVSSADLRGRVWVADFIFTNCPGICPILTQHMTRLDKALVALGAEDVRLVSFTVDPKRDTPEALRDYASRFGADPDRWLFLTGPRDALYQLIKDGFRLAVAERSEAEADSGELITHSDRFVLVDEQGRIRAYHRIEEPGALLRLVGDLSKLAEEGAR